MAGAYGGTAEGPLDDVYTFVDLKPGTFEIGPFTVTVDRVNHPVETYGVRVEHAGRVLAYSADTAPVRGADPVGPPTPTCSCARPVTCDGEANPPDLHLTGRDAGEAAIKAGAARLVLTHLVSAWGSEINAYESAASIFAGPVELAKTGMRFEI